MNWDLLIGLLIGLSGSILTLIGTIWTNKQKNTHEEKMLKLNQKQDFKRFILENSFKEYEFKTNIVKDISKETGKGFDLYPYDMYLITYMKIAEFMQKDDTDDNDLRMLLIEMESIKDEYEVFQK